MKKKIVMVALSVNKDTLVSNLLSKPMSSALRNMVDRIIVTSYDSSDLKEQFKGDTDIKWIHDEAIGKNTIAHNRLAYIHAASLLEYEYIFMVDDDFVVNPELTGEGSGLITTLAEGTRGIVNFTSSNCSTNIFNIRTRCGMLVNLKSWRNSIHSLEDSPYLDFSMDEVMKVNYHDELIFASILWLGGYDVNYVKVSGIVNSGAGRRYSTYSSDDKVTMKQILINMKLLSLGKNQTTLYPCDTCGLPTETNEEWTELAYKVRSLSIKS